MEVKRESPSGKASAFQADIRGFESRLPLSWAVSRKRLRLTAGWLRAQAQRGVIQIFRKTTVRVIQFIERRSTLERKIPE
jgi:hypothetical protein